jgi:hypothetical protein
LREFLVFFSRILCKLMLKTKEKKTELADKLKQQINK